MVKSGVKHAPRKMEMGQTLFTCSSSQNNSECISLMHRTTKCVSVLHYINGFVTSLFVLLLTKPLFKIKHLTPASLH